MAAHMAAIGKTPRTMVARGNDGEPSLAPRQAADRQTADRPTLDGTSDGVSGHVAAAAQFQPAQTASPPPETPFPKRVSPWLRLGVTQIVRLAVRP